LNTGHAFLSKGLNPSKQIVISDADIITNKITKNEQGASIPLPMGMLPFDEYQFANKSFYLNSIALLTAPEGLLESRNKTIILRLLDKNRLENNRFFWQLFLVLGPLLLLVVISVIWSHNRKRQFAAY
jgi:hypothetical protein